MSNKGFANQLHFASIYSSCALGNESEADSKGTQLATEMLQMVYDGPKYSNEFPSMSPQTDAKSSPHSKDKRKIRKTKKANPLQSKERDERHELDQLNNKCTICERSFKKAWNLKEHVQRHSIDRPFKCWLCHKG